MGALIDYLIAAGLAEMIVRDGQTRYRLTDDGMRVAKERGLRIPRNVSERWVEVFAPLGPT